MKKVISLLLYTEIRVPIHSYFKDAYYCYFMTILINCSFKNQDYHRLFTPNFLFVKNMCKI